MFRIWFPFVWGFFFIISELFIIVTMVLMYSVHQCNFYPKSLVQHQHCLYGTLMLLVGSIGHQILCLLGTTSCLQGMTHPPEILFLFLCLFHALLQSPLPTLWFRLFSGGLFCLLDSLRASPWGQGCSHEPWLLRWSCCILFISVYFFVCFLGGFCGWGSAWFV